jgi:soluble lytic murein transglycosylase-like protein
MRQAQVATPSGADRSMPTFRQRRVTTPSPVASATFASLLGQRRTGLAAADPASIGERQPTAGRPPTRSQLLRQDLAAAAGITPVDSSDAGTWADLINSTAARHGVDPSLVAAVTRAESGFNPAAVSRAGAKGLMQLMDPTARALGVTDSFDPVQNVDGGTRYLGEMLKRFGKPELALAAYNAGPVAVKKHGGVPPFKETQTYVQKVLDYHRQMTGVSR